MGASNLDAMQLAGALEVARKGDLPAWLEVLQPEYSLYHRSAFEGALCDLCVQPRYRGGDLLQSGLGVLNR
ncbi:hypothetical protein MJ390_08295 [Klebsiella pneumoniae]|nr:hypothetical protein MJ390_08295 [Klebsiella pneumoniae]